MDHQQLFERLSKSTFRARFQLSDKDKAYISKKGMEQIRFHTKDFIQNRLSDAYIENDGKQTPMRGHPVFIAQHATATCCRGCLNKWHHIPLNTKLTKKQQEYIEDVIMTYLENQMKDYKEHPKYEQMSLF